MEIVEVVDRESLKAHLGTLPKMPRLRTALWIASRSATRVSPFAIKFLLGRASEKNAPTTLSIFVAVSTAYVASVRLHDNYESSANGVSIANGAAVISYLAYSVSDFSAAHAADAVARATFSAQAHKSYAADAADATARANLALGISDVYWQVVRNDLEIAAKDMFYTRNSLWARDDIPSEISETWTFSKNALKKAFAEKWQFWIAW